MRTLQAQLVHALHQIQAFGQSKQLDREEDKSQTYDKIYSCNSLKTTIDTAKRFAHFMSSEHKEVKMVKDIKPEHVKDFLDRCSGSWSDRTLQGHMGRLAKLERACQIAYGKSHISFMEGVKEPERHRTEYKPEHREKTGNIRTVSMDRADYELLRGNTSRNAEIALNLTARCGLRVAECAGLHVQQIDIERREIHIREGAKNGKPRDVQIQERDIPYFSALKTELRSEGREYVCGGIRPDSINAAIRRSMHDLGLSDKYRCTAIHSVRKMYARELYNEKSAELGDSKAAWSYVQVQLGHGEGFREALYNTYIGK